MKAEAMSNVPKTNAGREGATMKSEKVDDIAARWFWKRDSGDWTESDQAQFDTWMQSSTANRVAYIRLNAGWKKSARMKALGAGVPAGVVPPKAVWGDTRFPRRVGQASQNVPTEAPRRVKNIWLAAAATFAVVALGVLLGDALLDRDRYTTDVGGRDTVPLADGSQVVLNTDTRIRVELGERERRIELVKGEAFFKVAKDASRPFVVDVADKRVVAVGTEFSVRRSGDNVRVAVVEGKVRMGETLLMAGSIATTASSEVLVRKDAAPEAQRLLSWRRGFLVFEATPLTEAVAEFNRYNERQIVIADASIAGFRIGGNFRADNSDAFLWLLQSGFQIAAQRHGDEVLLKRMQ
jgi:transmembrane sensor